jgi:cobalt-zinc-cadmium efflux system membrane fusion protein
MRIAKGPFAAVFVNLAMLGGLSLGLAACGSAPEPDKIPVVEASASTGPPKVELTQEQLKMIAVAAVDEHDFAPTTSAPGYIDFDQDTTVPVFSSYQGKIVQAFVHLGDQVAKGQPLFTVESPDLMNASSALLSAEATEIANKKALDRANTLHGSQGISDQNVEAAVSAEAQSNAALQAARAALEVFGKSPDAVLATHKVDPVLVVRSPISGRVTARNAQPGLLVQPGSATAPFTVGESSRLWMVATAAESDIARFHLGQTVDVTVPALPGVTLHGRIETMGASVDPATHTVPLRATVEDPQHLLRANMLATFAVHTGASVRALAVPVDGVVREGDGTMTTWVTTDGKHFTQRVIHVGMMRDGYDQIIDGLRAGERTVSKGAVFIDNMLAADPDAD